MPARFGTEPLAANAHQPARAYISDSPAAPVVGCSLIWNSPIGPLRADFAYALLKEQFDQTQVFRFGAATRF